MSRSVRPADQVVRGEGAKPMDGSLDRDFVSEPALTESEFLRLLAEDVSVTRETAETGRVKISKVTRTRDHVIDELLAHHSVEVERIPAGHEISADPGVRDDGETMIIPVIEEVLVMQRKLILREEIHVRRIRTDEAYRETIKLRYQDIQVTRLPAEAQVAAQDLATGADGSSTAQTSSAKGK